MRICVKCKDKIPQMRLEVLPDTKTCKGCSTEQGYVGAMVYDHKTAPRLVYVRPENERAVETLKRFVNRERE